MEEHLWPCQHLYSPMNKKKMSNPSSRMEAFKVRPRICSPLECRDNLNIRNTRTNLITLRIARDMAWFVLLSCGLTGARTMLPLVSSSATTVASVMKYGMIAMISIMFITSRKKFSLFGQARNLTDSSNVNQMMQMVSMRKNGSVTSGTSSSSILVPFRVVLNTL